MKRCVFKLVNSEAYYIKEYDPEIPLEPNEVIVSFTHNNFRDKVHIDDGDLKCIQILHENGMNPVVTR